MSKYKWLIGSLAENNNNRPQITAKGKKWLRLQKYSNYVINNNTMTLRNNYVTLPLLCSFASGRFLVHSTEQIARGGTFQPINIMFFTDRPICYGFDAQENEIGKKFLFEFHLIQKYANPIAARRSND